MDSLSKQAGLSTTAFRKRFRKEVGYSPLDYLNRQRVFEAQRLLNRGGFPNQGNFPSFGFRFEAVFLHGVQAGHGGEPGHLPGERPRLVQSVGELPHQSWLGR